jgi:queuine tRNA-ribosyltransferase
MRARPVLVFAGLSSFSSPFSILARDGSSEARRGSLRLAHADVETPSFMPVGTLGAVKGVSFDLLETWDCRLLLANTYHLMLRPGLEGVRRAGGLHAFMGWDRGILTDSGGFQVMSLEKNRRVTEEGVEFRSHLDGDLFRLTPEHAMELQGAFGVDVAMCLDVCPGLPAQREEIEVAVERTTRWAQRCRVSYRGPGALFGIVQGGPHEDLRARSARQITGIDFSGYAVGGVAVGEPKEQIEAITAYSASLLPADRPRYLMGVGTPADLLRGVRAGFDLFDCVLPTRNGRMGHAYTAGGEIAIKNARFARDSEALDPTCGCPVCRRHSRAYVRHLFVLKDITAPVLLSVHNVFFFLEWMRKIREAISSARLAELETPPEGKIA